MPSKTEPTWFNPEVASYIAARSAQPDKVLSELIERTRAAIERNAAPRLALEARFAGLGALPVH